MKKTFGIRNSGDKVQLGSIAVLGNEFLRTCAGDSILTDFSVAPHTCMDITISIKTLKHNPGNIKTIQPCK